MYVILQTNNPILPEYIEKFKKFQKQRLLDLQIVDESKVSSLLEDFFLYPDVNVLINYLYNNKFGEKFLEEKEGFYKSKLVEFIDNFLQDKFFFEKLRKTEIRNTNIFLTLEDYNPYSSYDAHPDHNHIVGTLGEKTFQDWQQVYDSTFEMFSKIDDGVVWELNQMIKKIVPMGTDKYAHNSASYKECFGTLYLGYTTGVEQPEINNIEAIIHESSHNKLNLIAFFDKLVLNNYKLTYYSPYRPDARHIWGVFLGIHAFTPTIFYLVKGHLKGLLNSDILLEKAYLYHLKNKYAFHVLKKYGKFTELGDKILQEVRETIQKTDVLFKGNISERKRNTAKTRFKEHLQDVIINYPYLKY